MKRILVDGGYIEGNTYYFYLTDYLGNNRVVTKADGTQVQKTHYYLFGSSLGYDAEAAVQPYKYNGKELDQMNRLDLYDYSARYYDSAIGRFTSVDPMAEKYYSISPYAYVANNPIKYIDPNGCDTIYVYKDGTEFDRIKASGDDVTIYGSSRDMVAENSAPTSNYIPTTDYIANYRDADRFIVYCKQYNRYENC